MGFLKGAATFTRFKVNGPKPGMFGQTHLDRLKIHADPGVAAADGTEAGWRAGGHIYDKEFELEKNVFPDHLAWDFRVQRDALPADRLKAYYETDLKALAATNPSGIPSARQKREARESARERLRGEAKDGRFRKWTLVPCLWDAVRNEVLFGGTSAKQVEQFARRFSETFAADLFQSDALAGGLQVRDAARLATALKPEAKDERLSPFTPNTPADGPAWCPQDAYPSFLGNEFLLWLWWFGNTQTDTVTARDGTEVVFMFSGGIRLEHPGDGDNDTINAASAVRKPQAKRAAEAGYLPRKAALTLVRQDSQFQFKLNAETLAVTGAKLPKPSEDAKGRGVLEERLGSVRDLVEAVDLLFDAFLSRRLSALWEHDLRDMQAWLEPAPAGKRKGKVA